jgi:N-acetyl-anhydromuramyl-L-alanine amidase AmpD
MNIDKSKKFTDFYTKCEGNRAIDCLILHHVQADSMDHAVEQFLQHKVSPHFVIDEDGKIFELVDENDIAYHAGISFWSGVDGLNKSSLGVEFINSSPFEKNFSEAQMIAGVELCKYLKAKYQIINNDIVGHSDVAYQGLYLDRKQDPSHLFNWKFLALNGVGTFPEVDVIENMILYEVGDEDEKIRTIKKKLARFGYRVLNNHSRFDEEMQHLARVFNRRFNREGFVSNPDVWYLRSDLVLNPIIVG